MAGDEGKRTVEKDVRGRRNAIPKVLQKPTFCESGPRMPIALLARSRGVGGFGRGGNALSSSRRCSTCCSHWDTDGRRPEPRFRSCRRWHGRDDHGDQLRVERHSGLRLFSRHRRHRQLGHVHHGDLPVRHRRLGRRDGHDLGRHAPPRLSHDLFAYGAPTVTGVSPNGGPPAGGTAVIIDGTGFAGGHRALRHGGRHERGRRLGDLDLRGGPSGLDRLGRRDRDDRPGDIADGGGGPVRVRRPLRHLGQPERRPDLREDRSSRSWARASRPVRPSTSEPTPRRASTSSRPTC